MRRIAVAGVALAVLTGSGAVRADNMWDVENARANARAGGPVSEYDAELLDRWGCLSGTNSAFCKRIEHGANSAGTAVRRRARKYQ